MHEKTLRLVVATPLVLLLLTSWSTPSPAEEGTISPSEKWAYNETSGWLNFEPAHAAVFVHGDYLTGFIWQENVGWIKLGSGGGPYANTSPSSWGVNRDVAGNLSGFAWSENAGWINFAPTHGEAAIDPVTGAVAGFVWSENLGWVHLRHDAPEYGVRVVFILVPALATVGIIVLLVWVGLRPSARRYRQSSG